MAIKVLLIDDQRDMLDAYGELLEQLGYSVVCTHSGQKGIELARRHIPDVIVCDIMMPNVDGFQVLTELRNYSETFDIPFIFLTAYGNDSRNIHKALDLGADHFLTKPTGKEQLEHAIQTRLERQRRAKEEETERMRRMTETVLNALPTELEKSVQGIIGCAQYLREMSNEGEIRMTTDRVHRTAQILERAAARVERLARNYAIYTQTALILADPEQIEQYRTHCTDQPGNLIYDITYQVVRAYERERDLRYKVNGTCPVRISAESLETIIHELITNALQYSQHDNRVFVCTETTDSHLHLTIRDEGMGMASQQIGQIGAFQRFEPGLYSGIGLGLAIVKNLLKIYDGTFEIDSEYGKYTECRISLRRAD